MRILFILLFVSSFFCCFADRVHLKNGKVLLGTLSEEGTYWILETPSGQTVKIKKFQVAWIEKLSLSEELLPKTQANPTTEQQLKVLKKLAPSRSFQEKYFGNTFRVPDPYYYGPTPTGGTPFYYASGVSGPGYFFGDISARPLSYYRPAFRHSSPSGLHFRYHYFRKNFGIGGYNHSFFGYYRSGNTSFRFRFHP